MSKHELVDWEDDDYQIEITGILCSWPDYRLSHYLNKTYGLNLINDNDGHPIDSKGWKSFFSIFRSTSNNNTGGLYLVVNKSYNTNNNTGFGLFSDLEVSANDYFVQKLKKWPFVLLSYTSDEKQKSVNAVSNNIISFKTFDFQSLNKSDSNNIYKLVYD